MSEYEQSPSQRLRIVTAIGREFERVSQPAGTARRAQRRSAPRGGKAMVLAVALGLLCVGAAGAATGLLPGDVIPGGSDPENPHTHGTADQTVVARGVSPVAGPWRLTSMRHEATSESPAGDCLELLLLKPPPGSPIAATLLCQDAGKAEFKADSVPVVNTETGKSEILLFGAAPEGAGSVSVAADSGKTFPAELRQGPATFPGDAWVVVLPSGQKTGKLKLTDQNGNPGAELDTATYFDQLATWERQLAGEYGLEP
jgi:hypothetical protein